MEPARARRLSAAAALALLLTIGQSWWLAALLPAQTVVTQRLLPEFETQPLVLIEHAGGLVLELRAATREHVVLQGRVFAPGVGVEVGTPARQSLRQALLVVALCAALLALRAGTWRSVAFALLGATSIVATAPVVLAGQAWALGLQDVTEPSLRALLVVASRLILNGADMAALLLAAVVLSAHSSAWFGWITATPTGEGHAGVTRRPA